MVNNQKTKKEGNFKGFFLCVLLVILALIVVGIILNNIAFPYKIKCEDTISTETITNLNEITLTKNNIYSLFDIEVVTYKKKNSQEANFTFNVSPQLKNYQYINCSITFRYDVGSNNIQQKTCLLNINGKGSCNQNEFVEYYSLEDSGYIIISVTGTMIKNT